MIRLNVFIPALLALAVTITSCKDNEPEPQQVPDLEVIESEVTPTEDQMKEFCTVATYVFDGSYVDEGAAVLRRIAVKANTLDENVKAILMTKNHIATLGDAKAEIITRIYLNGGCILVTEASANDIANLWETMLNALDRMEANHTLPSEYNSDALRFLRSYDRSPNPEMMPEGVTDAQDVVGISCHGTYITAQERLMKFTIKDKDGNEIQDDESMALTGDEELHEKHTEYYYGDRADRIVKWANDAVISNKDYSAMAAANNPFAASRAENVSLCELVNSHLVSYDINEHLEIYSQKDKDKITNEICSAIVNIESWSAHSFEKNDGCDYYAVRQKVFLRNSRLKGSSITEMDKWNKKYYTVAMYGAYLYGFTSRNSLYDENFTASPEYSTDVVEANPQKNMGSTTVTTGVNFTLSGNVAFSEKGPSAGLSMGATFVNQHSQTVPDMTITQQIHPYSTTRFDYTLSKQPEGRYFHAGHDLVPEFVRSDIWLEQGWVWRVHNPKGRYYAHCDLNVEINTLRVSFWTLFTTDSYISATANKTINYPLPTPPRYKENWRMGFKNLGKMDEVDNFLKTYYSKTWYPEFISCGIDADDAYAEACDDFRSFVTAFANDRVNWKGRVDMPIRFWVKKSDSPDIVLSATVDEDGNVTYSDK